MISGIKTLVVFDPVTGESVQVNNLEPKGEFKCDPQFTRNALYLPVFSTSRYSIEVSCFDDSAYDALHSFMTNRTKVNLLVMGHEEVIMWYRDATIIVEQVKQFQPGKLNTFSVSTSAEGVLSDIYRCINIAQALLGWKDVDNNGIVDNYIIENSSAPLDYDFTNSIQTISNTANDSYNAVLRSMVTLPVSGFTLALYANVRTLTANRIVRCLDFNDNLLLQVSQVNAGALVFTTPPGTWNIEFEIVHNVLERNESITVGRAYLGVVRSNYNVAV